MERARSQAERSQRHGPDAEATPASLGDLLRCLVRARWALLAWMLGGALLAAAWTARARPLFRARATVLIEQQNGSGLLGELSMLASIGSAPATASELSVLESRVLAEELLIEGTDSDGGWDPLDERHLGLTMLVDDTALRPAALLRRKLFAPPPPDEPLVLPGRGLAARVLQTAPDSPRRLRLEFTERERVRISTVGLLPTLRLAPRQPEELEFQGRGPLRYRGVVLELAPWGDYAGASFTLEILSQHEALRRLRQRISVRETSLNSGVIEIAVTDTDPRRAARTVNALCSSYLDSLARRGQRRASKTVEYVQGLLDEEVTRFEGAQAEVLRLQQSQPELIAPEGAASSLIEQMATLEVERVQVELSERAFGEIVAALEAGDRRALGRIDDRLTAGVLVDPLTSGLLEELARLDAQASSLETDLLEGHPLLEQNAAASAALLVRTREQLVSRIEGLSQRRTQLERVGGELRQRLAEMPEGLRQMAEAQVEFGIHRELVPYLLKSLQGAEITRSSAETWAEVVDPAVPPDRLAAPDLARWLALGLLAGLGAGVAFAFSRERLRGRVYTGEELGRALGAEFVAVVTRLSSQELVFRSARLGPTAETLRRLRGALRFAPDGSTRRIVGVSEIGSDAFAVTLAAELALAFAGEGRRTLLVETGGSSLAHRFGLEQGPGLAEHLARGEAWRELVHSSGEEAPDTLLGGSIDEPPGDLLARPALERFLAEAGQDYEAVVLALPRAEALPAMPALTRNLDALCLVHRARTQARARVAEAARALRAAGARELSGVLVEKR